jgi:hypothetical protein
MIDTLILLGQNNTRDATSATASWFHLGARVALPNRCRTTRKSQTPIRDPAGRSGAGRRRAFAALLVFGDGDLLGRDREPT